MSERVLTDVSIVELAARRALDRAYDAVPQDMGAIAIFKDFIAELGSFAADECGMQKRPSTNSQREG